MNSFDRLLLTFKIIYIFHIFSQPIVQQILRKLIQS